MSDAFITNGRIIDPANNIDEVGAIFIADGKIAWVNGNGKPPEPQTADVYNATGLVVAPGLN